MMGIHCVVYVLYYLIRHYIVAYLRGNKWKTPIESGQKRKLACWIHAWEDHGSISAMIDFKRAKLIGLNFLSRIFALGRERGVSCRRVPVTRAAKIHGDTGI